MSEMSHSSASGSGAKDDLFSFLYAQMQGTAPVTSSSSTQTTDQTEALNQKWTALLDRATVRWDGQAASWQQFRTAFLHAATAEGVESKAQEFLGKAEAMGSDQSKFNFLRVYNLTKDSGDAPADLSEYTPMLYRLSQMHPTNVLTATGWGTNVYAAIFPTSITPTPDEIKTLLPMASQQSMGSFLYRFPLAAASIGYFKYMNTQPNVIKQAIAAWDPATMRLVEVICTETPDRAQIQVSVGGNWMQITALPKKKE